MLHMEQYPEAAGGRVIAAAVDLRRRPEGVKRRFRYHDEESVLDDAKKKGKKSFRVLPDAVVIFDDNSPTVLHKFRGHERGRYRIRISASAYQAAGRPVWLKLYATDFKTKRLLGYFDLPAEGKREVEVISLAGAGGAARPSAPSTPTMTTMGRSITTLGPRRSPAAAWRSSGSKSKARWLSRGRRRVSGGCSARPGLSRSSQPDPIGEAPRSRSSRRIRGWPRSRCSASSRPEPSAGRSHRRT